MTYLPRNITKRALAFIFMILVLYMHGRAQLTVSVSTDKPVYNYGETITLTGTVTNQADTAVEVVQAYQGPVNALFFDNIHLGWMVLATNILYEYAPHTSHNWFLKIDGFRLGLPNKEGPYCLTCYFQWQDIGSDFIYNMNDSVMISQPVFYGGELQVDYSIHTPRSEIQNLLDSMKATVVSSDTFEFSETVYDRWQTSGFILDSLYAKYASDSRLSSIEIHRSISPPTMVVNGIASSSSKIAGYRLSQNYPNPFNPGCIIDFEIPSSQQVRLSVFDVLGRLVWIYDSYISGPGVHHIAFDGSKLPSGIYFYEIISAEFSQTRRMLLIR
ncbi:MAG: T9SS type A sorting domain-containing protein [Bacteroidota bacterium]